MALRRCCLALLANAVAAALAAWSVAHAGWAAWVPLAGTLASATCMQVRCGLELLRSRGTRSPGRRFETCRARCSAHYELHCAVAAVLALVALVATMRDALKLAPYFAVQFCSLLHIVTLHDLQRTLPRLLLVA